MSNSKRKTPIAGICSGSDKEDKREYNRRFRRIVKAKISSLPPDIDDLILPEVVQEVSELWGMNKDGKFFFGEWKNNDTPNWTSGTKNDLYNELMRK